MRKYWRPSVKELLRLPTNSLLEKNFKDKTSATGSICEEIAGAALYQLGMSEIFLSSYEFDRIKDMTYFNPGTNRIERAEVKGGIRFITKNSHTADISQKNKVLSADRLIGVSVPSPTDFSKDLVINQINDKSNYKLHTDTNDNTRMCWHIPSNTTEIGRLPYNEYHEIIDRLMALNASKWDFINKHKAVGRAINSGFSSLRT